MEPRCDQAPMRFGFTFGASGGESCSSGRGRVAMRGELQSNNLRIVQLKWEEGGYHLEVRNHVLVMNDRTLLCNRCSLRSPLSPGFFNSVLSPPSRWTGPTFLCASRMPAPLPLRYILQYFPVPYPSFLDLERHWIQPINVILKANGRRGKKVRQKEKEKEKETPAGILQYEFWNFSVDCRTYRPWKEIDHHCNFLREPISVRPAKRDWLC